MPTCNSRNPHGITKDSAQSLLDKKEALQALLNGKIDAFLAEGGSADKIRAPFFATIPLGTQFINKKDGKRIYLDPEALIKQPSCPSAAKAQYEQHIATRGEYAANIKAKMAVMLENALTHYSVENRNTNSRIKLDNFKDLREDIVNEVENYFGIPGGGQDGKQEPNKNLVNIANFLMDNISIMAEEVIHDEARKPGEKPLEPKQIQSKIRLLEWGAPWSPVLCEDAVNMALVTSGFETIFATNTDKESKDYNPKLTSLLTAYRQTFKSRSLHALLHTSHGRESAPTNDSIEAVATPLREQILQLRPDLDTPLEVVEGKMNEYIRRACGLSECTNSVFIDTKKPRDPTGSEEPTNPNSLKSGSLRGMHPFNAPYGKNAGPPTRG